jgi:DNA-binding MarR family transcriptional regulator
MDGTQTKFGLHDSIGHHITRSARAVERRVDEGLKRHGLTRVGWCILLAVGEEGKRNPSEIANFVGIDRTATSRALRLLESRGLIERSMGRSDRRMTDVAITDEGLQQLYSAMPLCQEAMAHFHAKITRNELAELKRLLAKLNL